MRLGQTWITVRGEADTVIHTNFIRIARPFYQIIYHSSMTCSVMTLQTVSQKASKDSYSNTATYDTTEFTAANHKVQHHSTFYQYILYSLKDIM
jgi:hypothetical protein